MTDGQYDGLQRAVAMLEQILVTLALLNPTLCVMNHDTSSKPHLPHLVHYVGAQKKVVGIYY